MFEMHQLSGGYGKRTIFHGFSAQIPKGSFVVLLGPNGSGKSTLLKTLAGILPAQAGTLTVDGTPVAFLSPKERARKIAFLAQRNATPAITLQTLVLHGRFPHLPFPRKISGRDLDIVTDALRQMNVFHLKDQLLSRLSGGEVQKAYLAMTLAQQAPILILDEPTTYLDVYHQQELLKILTTLKNSGKTIIASLHDIPSALQYADCLCLLQEGMQRFSGTANALVQTNLLKELFGLQIEMEIKKGKLFFSFE